VYYALEEREERAEDKANLDATSSIGMHEEFRKWQAMDVSIA